MQNEEAWKLMNNSNMNTNTNLRVAVCDQPQMCFGPEHKKVVIDKKVNRNESIKSRKHRSRETNLFVREINVQICLAVLTVHRSLMWNS